MSHTSKKEGQDKTPTMPPSNQVNQRYWWPCSLFVAVVCSSVVVVVVVVLVD